jgi:phosphopantothenoylcysteine synthetase/decarboxylase
MTIIQKLWASLVICQVAHRQGISVAQCRSEMTAAIREAWSTSDPEVRKLQTDLVGDSHMPSPEELIFLISSKNA